MSIDQVSAALRARVPILWIVTPEEARVESELIEALPFAGYNYRLHDCIAGVTDVAGRPFDLDPAVSALPGNGADPDTALGAMPESPVKAAWIFRDLAAWLENATLGIGLRRRLRNLARSLPREDKARAKTIIILGVSPAPPPDLADHCKVIRWSLPDRARIGRIYDAVMSRMPEDIRAAHGAAEREAALEAAVGLTANASETCFLQSLVTQSRRIVPAYVAENKKALVAAGKGLEWSDPDPRGLDAIGGLSLLKSWLSARAEAWSPEARAYGLPAPRGILLAGVPGTGKSLAAKAVAAAWGVPLVRLDLGGSKSKWVGESEGNIRRALETVDAIGRCVLWIDELEKALAGATDGAADSGVSSDALGVLLSWMQDRRSEVFVVATANDVSRLPPELLRKGRFDDLFFVDLPTTGERADVLSVALRQRSIDPETVNRAAVASATAGFTGSEVAALVAAALYRSFADGRRPLATGDLVAEARATVPISRSAGEKIDALRKWAVGRARPASEPEVSAPSAGAMLDL
jgi:ATPase family associated with various cellular activities (AAA)